MWIKFFKNTEDMKACASYVAELTKQGVAFSIKNFDNFVEVALTGGF